MIFFTKMQGTGNDFIIIDNREKEIVYTYSRLSEFLCNRKFGVGADGVIFIEKSSIADSKMRIFNLDGSEAEMCGNGIRCLAKYLYEREIVKKQNMSIETLAGIKKVKLTVENKTVIGVNVDMGKPVFEYSKIPVIFPNIVRKELESLEIEFKNKKIYVFPISIGNPHAVCFVKNVNALNIEIFGKKIENYKYFPNKTNVEFVEIVNSKTIKMRVWERGVGETLSCGTGACAAAVVAYLKKFTNGEITVELLGGKVKVLYIEKENRVNLIGDSSFVFEGKI